MNPFREVGHVWYYNSHTEFSYTELHHLGFDPTPKWRKTYYLFLVFMALVASIFIDKFMVNGSLSAWFLIPMIIGLVALTWLTPQKVYTTIYGDSTWVQAAKNLDKISKTNGPYSAKAQEMLRDLREEHIALKDYPSDKPGELWVKASRMLNDANEAHKELLRKQTTSKVLNHISFLEALDEIAPVHELFELQEKEGRR